TLQAAHRTGRPHLHVPVPRIPPRGARDDAVLGGRLRRRRGAHAARCAEGLPRARGADAARHAPVRPVEAEDRRRHRLPPRAPRPDGGAAVGALGAPREDAAGRVMTGARRTRVGVIGLGRAGRVHLDAWRALPEVEVVAVADPSPDVVKAARAEGLAVTTATRELLGMSGLDAVSICAPPVHHAPLAIAALERGL